MVVNNINALASVNEKPDFTTTQRVQLDVSVAYLTPENCSISLSVFSPPLLAVM